MADGVASPVASAANAAGAALIAYDDDRTGALYVSERAPGRPFSRPRRLDTGRAGAAAISARGDRVLAWWGRGGVYARTRRAGRPWGPAQLAARATPVANATLRAAITPGGRTVLAWSTADVREDRPTPVAAGVAIQDVGKGWRAFGLERAVLATAAAPFPVGSPAIPIIDSVGRTYVAWTGLTGTVLSVKFAQVTAAGPRGLASPSGDIPGGAAEDAAAGPGEAIVVSWSVAGTSAATTYASLRRGSAGFAAAERLTPVGSAGIAGSRAGFASTTGQAVVTWASVSADRQVVLHASAGPGTLL